MSRALRIVPETRVRTHIIYLGCDPRIHWQGCRAVRQEKEGSQYKVH